MRELLTDFNTSRWEGIDLESVKQSFNDIKEKMDNGLSVFGELDHPSAIETNLEHSSHEVKNIELIDDKIYGEISFLPTTIGKVGKELYEKGFSRFGIRAAGSTSSKIKFEEKNRVYSETDPYGEEIWDDDNEVREIEIRMTEIFTWDLIPKE